MSAKHDATSLGALVQIYEGVHPDAVRRALDLQTQAPELRLGQALERLALLDRPRLMRLLATQTRLRAGRVREDDVRVLLAHAADAMRANAAGFARLAELRRKRRG